MEVPMRRALGAPQRCGGRGLLRLLDEVTRRDADQEQQRANDRRRADDLHRLALRLDAIDGVEQRARAHEIDALDVASCRSARPRAIWANSASCAIWCVAAPVSTPLHTTNSVPESDAASCASCGRSPPRARPAARRTTGMRRRFPRRRRLLERDRVLDRAVVEGFLLLLELQELEREQPRAFARVAPATQQDVERRAHLLRLLQRDGVAHACALRRARRRGASRRRRRIRPPRRDRGANASATCHRAAQRLDLAALARRSACRSAAT